MKEVNVRKFEMCIRSNDFLSENPLDFAKGSMGAQLVKRFDTAVAEIKDLIATNASEESSALSQTTNRVIARDAVRAAMETINHFAQGLAITTPGLDSSFPKPPRHGDSALLAAALAYIKNAAPLKSEFVRFELPSTFIDDLQTRVETFEQAVAGRSGQKASHVARTQAIDHAIQSALDTLAQLDPILGIKLADNPTLLLKWQNARHIERAWISKAAKGNGNGNGNGDSKAEAAIVTSS